MVKIKHPNDQPAETLVWDSRQENPRGAGAVDYEKMRIRSPIEHDLFGHDLPTATSTWNLHQGHPRDTGATDYTELRMTDHPSGHDRPTLAHTPASNLQSGHPRDDGAVPTDWIT